MINPINELKENIDQFVLWLRNNTNVPIPASEKRRLTALLNKVIASEEISNEEWEAMKPKSQSNKISNSYILVKPQKKTPQKERPKPKLILPLKQIQKKKVEENIVLRNGKKYTLCLYCNAAVKDLKKHSKKCTYKIPQKKKKIKPAKEEGLSNPYDLKNKKQNEYKNETNLDGARDYWKIRDVGKFGSHSSYDDMGDESSS